ncbi:MAG: hypothetical protein B7733_17455 [Myxococcales bacterium FL481]|nr:MAG: hypothetical protein B7733_17455 [Myxococcales bacterium FL481]
MAATVLDEAQLIARIKDAFVATDHAVVLRLIAEHERRFARGAMTEDRMAWKAVALCQSGAVSKGAVAAARLMERFPHSPHTRRVGAACGR